jgi:hypothetical protein
MALEPRNRRQETVAKKPSPVQMQEGACIQTIARPTRSMPPELEVPLAVGCVEKAAWTAAKKNKQRMKTAGNSFPQRGLISEPRG